ncbi:MAG TPA: DUF3237 domain-containing protein [Bryobacteraceae bacterium]
MEPITRVAPELRFVFEVRADVGAPLEIGVLPSGSERRVIPILGGTFEGPSVRGRVLPGGADSQIVHPNGSAELDARYTLQTDTGALISVFNRGVRNGPPEVLAKLRAGERVPAASYYFRAVPKFETGDPGLQWLCEKIFVCSGERLAAQVILRFFEVC